MTNRSELNLSELCDYIEKMTLREPPLLMELREETAQLPNAMMQIAADQGQFMQLLIKLMGATRALEIGTFTGYSALAVASALPEAGRLVCCDISEEWTNIGQRYWEQAGVSHKIDLKLGDAVDTLNTLIDANTELFDFVFIDADKSNYINYYEKSKQLLRPGGLIAIDNVLWSGKVVDEANQETDTIAIRNFNQHVAEDHSVDVSLIPIADGLTLARKK